MENKYVNMYKRFCNLSQFTPQTREFNGGHLFHKVRII